MNVQWRLGNFAEFSKESEKSSEKVWVKEWFWSKSWWYWANERFQSLPSLKRKKWIEVNSNKVSDKIQVPQKMVSEVELERREKGIDWRDLDMKKHGWRRIRKMTHMIACTVWEL
jgi:hypothetical protein